MTVENVVTSTMTAQARGAIGTQGTHLRNNWRWQMCLVRAYYDAYIRHRLINETRLEEEANAILAEAVGRGAEVAMQEAMAVLNQCITRPVSPQCDRVADEVTLPHGHKTRTVTKLIDNLVFVAVSWLNLGQHALWNRRNAAPCGQPYRDLSVTGIEIAVAEESALAVWLGAVSEAIFAAPGPAHFVPGRPPSILTVLEVSD